MNMPAASASTSDSRIVGKDAGVMVWELKRLAKMLFMDFFLLLYMVYVVAIY